MMPGTRSTRPAWTNATSTAVPSTTRIRHEHRRPAAHLAHPREALRALDVPREGHHPTRGPGARTGLRPHRAGHHHRRAAQPPRHHRVVESHRRRHTMSDVRALIALAERLESAPPGPVLVPEYQDDERPEVKLGWP